MQGRTCAQCNPSDLIRKEFTFQTRWAKLEVDVVPCRGQDSISNLVIAQNSSLY